MCICLSTTTVLGASTAKQKKAAKGVLKFKKTTQLTIDIGKTQKLTVQNNKSSLSWTSNHSEVVQVSAGGRITPQRPGNAVITATNNNGVKAKCKVFVSCDGGLISRDTMTRMGASSCSKLMIVAHPDDETFFGGHYLREGGWFVVCLTNGYNPTRAGEFNNTLRSTGNRGMILNYPDYQDNRKDNWKKVKKGISTDVGRMIDYKKWKKITTHNKWGEYGHIHHRLTHKIVLGACQEKDAYDHLYYFGNFYWPNDIPKNEKRLPAWAEAQKQELSDAYYSQRGALRILQHMIPYENWKKAPAGDKIITRKIGVKTSTKGEPAEGYRVTKVTVSKEKITIKGKRSRINKLSKKTAVKIPAVNVKGKKKSFKVKVPIKKLIPKKTQLAKGAPKTITVKVEISPVANEE